MRATLCACQKSACAKKSPVAVTQSKKKRKTKKKILLDLQTHYHTGVGWSGEAASGRRICFTPEKRQDVRMYCWLKSLNSEWGKYNISFICWLKDPINTSWRTMWLKNTWFDGRLGRQNRCKMFNSRRVKSVMRVESGVFVQHPTPAKLAKYYSSTWQFLNLRLWVFWGFTDLPFYRMDWLEQLIKGRTLLCHGFTKHFSDSQSSALLAAQSIFFFSPFQKLSP